MSSTSSHSAEQFNINDLTPEQQKMLIDIRRRKTELLLEIQNETTAMQEALQIWEPPFIHPVLARP